MKKRASFKSSILHQNKFGVLTSNRHNNQISSTSPELPMHNRSLIWTFHNIQYKSLPKYLLQTPISICCLLDHFFFLCIFHIQNIFNLVTAPVSYISNKKTDMANIKHRWSLTYTVMLSETDNNYRNIMEIIKAINWSYVSIYSYFQDTSWNYEINLPLFFSHHLHLVRR